MSGTPERNAEMEGETGTDEGIEVLRRMSKEELIRVAVDDAKNWLAHDGLWFQEVEAAHGMQAAVAADRNAWEKFTAIEARRIMSRLGMEPGGGIPALVECLKHRMYARLNKQRCTEITERRCVFQMIGCRVQETRRRKGLPSFGCKEVGMVEFSGFAKAVDPRIETRCVACPPDAEERGYWCAWEFVLG
jgi:hypothetical protein